MIDDSPFDIYFRAFKEEGELELWSRKQGTSSFQLMKSYDICAKSGSIGPKSEEGDRQVPEGFYLISRFNPMSKYHLSLGINYPNPSDLKRSGAARPGGDIFVHGNCVTIGCLPMTDEHIEEIYLLCIEAKDRGADEIPITIFPKRLDPKNYSELMSDERYSPQVKELWSSLKSAYDYFYTEERPPSLRFDSDGKIHLGG